MRQTSACIITDVYFFEVDPKRTVERIDFDREKIDKYQSGLHVEIKSKNRGQAAVSIAGLERITSFIWHTKSLGKDLSVLKGKEVTEYYKGIFLLGIGVD